MMADSLELIIEDLQRAVDSAACELRKLRNVLNAAAETRCQCELTIAECVHTRCDMGD